MRKIVIALVLMVVGISCFAAPAVVHKSVYFDKICIDYCNYKDDSEVKKFEFNNILIRICPCKESYLIGVDGYGIEELKPEQVWTIETGKATYPIVVKVNTCKGITTITFTKGATKVHYTIMGEGLNK